VLTTSLLLLCVISSLRLYRAECGLRDLDRTIRDLNAETARLDDRLSDLEYRDSVIRPMIVRSDHPHGSTVPASHRLPPPRPASPGAVEP